MPESLAEVIIKLHDVQSDEKCCRCDNSEICSQLLVLVGKRKLADEHIIVKVEVDSEKDNENRNNHFYVHAVVMRYTVAVN